MVHLTFTRNWARAAVLLLTTLCCLTGARAQETLTVYDGQGTNNSVPAYIYYFDYFTKSQFVIPANDLDAMSGGTISEIKFYTTASSIPYETKSEADVYLKEVDYTTISDFEPKGNATIVYHGKLNIESANSGGELTITFTTPFNYNGGNLLIGIENTTDVEYKNIYFYGESGHQGASIAAYNSTSLDNVVANNSSSQGFIPKTTFTYEPASTGCDKPETFVASDITANGATFSWTGDADSYTFEYKKAAESEWTVVGKLTTSSYTLNDLEQNTAYNARVKAVCSQESESYYSILNFTTPELYPTPTDLVCTSLTATTATLDWVDNGEATAWQICLNGDEDNLISVNTKPYALAVPAADTNYEIKVRAVYGTTFSSWSNTISIFTGYCTPNPSSRDGKGITKVNFGIGDYIVDNVDNNGLPATSPFYGNYTNMVGAMFPGVESKVTITYVTGSYTVYSYGTIIWVDWNNNLTFEDSEIVYTGMSSQGSGGQPQVLEAVFTVPNDQPLGDYRMRIAGADSYFDSYINGTSTADHDACFTSTYAVCHDYTIRVLEEPSCTAPSDLAAADITINSAELSWTVNSGEEAWTIYYKEAEDENYTSVDVDVNPYTLTGLKPGTVYDVYVTAICSDTDQSMASRTFSFATKCDEITQFPWSEDFESFEASNDGVSLDALCWTNEHIDGDGFFLFEVYMGGYNSNTTHQLRLHDMRSGTKTKLVLPAMSLDNTNYQFSIDVYRSSNYTSYTAEGIRVFASADGEIEGATELAFIPRVYSTGNDVIPAEETKGWFTYNLPLGMSGTCYIILRGESQYGEATYIDNFIVSEIPAIELADDADNTSLIEDNDGKLADVTLSGRTLYKDRTWNTLVLPFNYDLTADGNVLEGADVRSLSGASYSGNKLKLNFTSEGDVEEIEAGKPYIIRWKTASNTNLESPVFSGVTIDKTTANTVADLGDEKTLVFQGIYAPLSYDTEKTSELFLGADNKLYWPQKGAYVGAQRAIFSLSGFSADDAAGVRFVLDFGEDGGTTTGIISVNDGKTVETGDWYDLNGRKLDNMPARKGVYIRNGKKEVIK